MYRCHSGVHALFQNFSEAGLWLVFPFCCLDSSSCAVSLKFLSHHLLDFIPLDLLPFKYGYLPGERFGSGFFRSHSAAHVDNPPAGIVRTRAVKHATSCPFDSPIAGLTCRHAVHGALIIGSICQISLTVFALSACMAIACAEERVHGLNLLLFHASVSIAQGY